MSFFSSPNISKLKSLFATYSGSIDLFNESDAIHDAVIGAVKDTTATWVETRNEFGAHPTQIEKTLQSVVGCPTSTVERLPHIDKLIRLQSTILEVKSIIKQEFCDDDLSKLMEIITSYRASKLLTKDDMIQVNHLHNTYTNITREMERAWQKAKNIQ